MMQKKIFQLNNEMEWENAGPGIQRQLYGYGEQVMMVSGSGVFEIKDAKPLRFGPGGGAYVAVPGHHVHRVSCTTAWVL